MDEPPSERIGGYAHALIYRVPVKNHKAFADTEGKLATIFIKCGILSSNFFVLSSTDTFKGFTSVSKAVSARPDEEVWLELDFYKDKADKDAVVARIGKEPDAGPLFGQILTLVAPRSEPLQGDFGRTPV
ncbi:MAG TPA: DUF1428 family protein [Nitrososphaerales archaeon]|nr:DUF1428 family protein [Nitrososphaerales archaeon]